MKLRVSYPISQAAFDGLLNCFIVF